MKKNCLVCREISDFSLVCRGSKQFEKHCINPKEKTKMRLSHLSNYINLWIEWIYDFKLNIEKDPEDENRRQKKKIICLISVLNWKESGLKL
jgi:hypothetical protein